MNIKRKVIINKLLLPVDGFGYDVKLLTSIDGGQSYYYAGFGRFARTLPDAQRIAERIAQENAAQVAI